MVRMWGHTLLYQHPGCVTILMQMQGLYRSPTTRWSGKGLLHKLCKASFGVPRPAPPHPPIRNDLGASAP